MRNLLACLMLSACMASGLPYSDSLATVVVYRAYEPQMLFGTIDIEVNGIPACDLNPDGYFLINETGKINITSHRWDRSGISLVTIDVKSNQTYYVSVIRDQRLIGGLLGESIKSQGPYQFTIVNPVIAKEQLNKLHQDCM